MTRKRKDVALLIETSNPYSRGLLEGIVAWQREHDMWSIYLPEQERGAAPPSWLKNWKGDGIIARIETEEIATAVRRTKLPIVDVSAARHVPDAPWVETNDQEIARLAIEHFLERGFVNFAFCGEPHFKWSQLREQYFIGQPQAVGREFAVYQSRTRFEKGYSWNRERGRLLRWLNALSTPVGIMACYDIKGQQILDACRELDMVVAEQVAVIGVDNDDALCELCTPPLTSVLPDTRRTGYEAASLLNQIMAGQCVPPSSILIELRGIVERLSTDSVAVADPHVRRALRFIRQHISERIDVSDVVRHVQISRRFLESIFTKIVGRTPHREIERVRLNRVKRLLAEPIWPLRRVISLCGIDGSET